jgi:hypothetical protein
MEPYRVQRTAFEPGSTFSLEGGRLVRGVSGSPVQQVELTQVRRVRLSYQPFTTSDRWVCSVETPGGRIWIPSTSFLGVGRTTDQRAQFRAFVQGLNEAVAASGAANVVFIQGSAWSSGSSLVLLICLGVVGLLLLLGLLGGLAGGGGFGAVGWVFLPLLTSFWAAQLVWRTWRGNPLRPYVPRALPADFAPVGGR